MASGFSSPREDDSSKPMEGSALDHDALLSTLDGICNGPGAFTVQVAKDWKSVHAPHVCKNSQGN
eukprot:2528263-Rhodomonas_salina.5